MVTIILVNAVVTFPATESMIEVAGRSEAGYAKHGPQLPTIPGETMALLTAGFALVFGIV
jgi:hypothetical protein